jgi:hypothetical protein
MEKIYMKKAILLVALLLLNLLCGCNKIVNGIFFGPVYWFEPKDVPFDFEQDKEIDLQFEVVMSCDYAIGIGFRSKAPGSEIDRHDRIKAFFGKLSEGLDFPSEVDIQVTNDTNETIFVRNGLGGTKIHNFISGPNPIRFIAGHAYLQSGIYHAKIMVNKRFKDFHELEAFFFAYHDPKFTCGKK